MKESFEKQPYKGSPLESILTNMLNKIRQLKEKYPKKTSPSFEQIQAIETVVKVFNEEILPRFDNKTPDLFDMWAIGKQIYGFDETLGETFYSLATPKALFFGSALSVFAQEVWSYVRKNNDVSSLKNAELAKNLDLNQETFVQELKKQASSTWHVNWDTEFDEVKQSLLGLAISNYDLDMLKDINIVLPLFLKLLDQLFTNTEKTAAFIIDGPMFFELVVYLTELIDQAPEELQKLIPFFKPETIIDLASEKILGKNISIVYEKNFEYKIKLGVDGKHGELIVDLYALQAASSFTFKNIIFSAIASYMKQNPNELLVKNEIVQSQALQSYVRQESEVIQNKVRLHAKNCIPTLKYDLEGLALVQKIDEEINCNALLFIRNSELQAELTSQLEDFHPNIFKHSEKDRNNGLINPYSTKKMPSNVVGWNVEKNALAVIPIKEKLDSVIKEQIQRLNQSGSLLQDGAEELQRSRQQALEQWAQCEQQKQLQYCEDLLFEQQRLLENYKKESIPASVNLEGEQQNTLDSDIEWIEQRLLILKSLKIGLTDCLNKARQSTKLPQESISYDHSGSLQNALAEEFKLFERNINTLSEDIAITSEQLHNQLRQKEQDRFEAVRKECLNFEDHWKIQQSLSKYTEERFILGKKYEELGCHLKSVVSQINDNAAPLNALFSFNDEQKKALEQSAKATRKSIRNAFATIRKYMPSCLPGNTQIELNDFNACTEWIQKSYRFVEKTLKLQDKNNLQPPLLYVDRVDIYSNMQAMLDDALINRLPFVELETLVLDKLFDDSMPQIMGFANVLQCLGMQEYKQKFIDFQHRQEAFWRSSPTKDERTYLFNLLTESIKLKSNEQKRHYHMAMSCEAFSALETHLKTTSIKKSNFDLSQSKYVAMDQCMQILKSEQMDLTKQMRELEDQCHVLDTTKYILQSKIKLLEDIKLQDAALTLLNQKKDFLELNPLIFEMQNTQTRLINQVNQLGMSTDVSTFRVRVESIGRNTMFIIQNHFDAKQLSERLATNSEHFAALKDKGLKHIARDKILEDFIQSSKLAMDFYDLFQEVGDIVIQMNNSYFVDEMANIEDLTLELHKNIKTFGCSVLEQLMVELAEQLTKANVFKSLELPEHSQQFLLNEATFGDVGNYLKQFAGISQFNQTLSLYSKDASLIKEFTESIEAVDTQLKDSIWLNKGLAERIENRTNLVETWSNTLEGILAIHSGKYDEFINELKLQMTAFKDSGRSVEVYNAICDKQKMIPKEYQLQRVLNQLKLALVDSDRQIPSTYRVMEPTNYSALAGQLLRDHADKPYVAKMRHVQTQIRVLADFGVTLSHESDQQHIAALVEKLTEDLDYFVVKQGGVVPSTESQQKFAELFLARLHSKDEELSERRDTWEFVFPILVNIAIGVAFLGFVIVGKLIHSKMTTDKFSFFCEKTNRVDQIEVTDEAIQQRLVALA